MTTKKRASPRTVASKRLTSGPAARSKVRKVMHEYKTGSLHSRSKKGPVQSRKRAVVIALSEAGASNK